MKKQIAAEIAKMGIPIKNGKMKLSDIRAAVKKCSGSIGGDEDFTTEVDVEVLNMPKGIPDTAELVTKIMDLNWRLYIDTREWGVKSLSVFVPDQEIELDFIDVEDNDKEYTATIKISDPDIEMDFKMELGSGFSPATVLLAKDHTTVSFKRR